MAQANLNMSMGNSGGVKRVGSVAKQPLVLDQNVVAPKNREKKKKRDKKKQSFDAEDKIEISGAARRENFPSSNKRDADVEKDGTTPKPQQPKRIDVLV